MFGFFKKKKSKVQQLIDDRGYEQAVIILAGTLIERLPNRAAAYEFILQELDGASMGNENSQRAAANSGIPHSHYKGALKNDVPEIQAAQDNITDYACQLVDNQESMARLRVDITAEVMKHFEFGRFSHTFGTFKPPTFGDDDDLGRNFVIKPNGFTVTDRDTGDILAAVIKGGMFQGAVSISRFDMTAKLEPWPLHLNPFQDDYNFSGSGFSPKGRYEFSITPSVSFTQILELARAQHARVEGRQMFAPDITAQDPYLERVADILHTTMAPMMSLQNVYNLAKECFGELQQDIANGTFRPGPNPRETVMAYYCLCSMVRESSSADDKQMVWMISIMAGALASEFEGQETFTPLEKGICIFGERTLKEYFPTQTKEDIASLKQKASDIVFEITNANGALLSRDDATTLINNVCATIPETDAWKGGEKVLAIFALTNITGYAIDQGDIDGANAYFACVMAAMKKYVEGQRESFNDYQMKTLRKIISDYGPIIEELKEANKRSATS